MKILEVKNLTIPRCKVIRFENFPTSEATLRRRSGKVMCLNFRFWIFKSYEFVQMNEATRQRRH